MDCNCMSFSQYPYGACIVLSQCHCHCHIAEYVTPFSDTRLVIALTFLQNFGSGERHFGKSDPIPNHLVKMLLSCCTSLTTLVQDTILLIFNQKDISLNSTTTVYLYVFSIYVFILTIRISPDSAAWTF